MRVDDVEADLPKPDAAFYTDLIRLPGVGSPPDRCRGLSPVGFCDQGHVALGRSSCDTRYCPDHFRGWVRKGTVSAVARLAAYRAARDGWEKRLLHTVFSPVRDRVSVERFWALRSQAYEQAASCGVRGGLCLAHPYRTSDQADFLFESVVESEDAEWEAEWGKWSFLRDQAGGDWTAWQEFVEPGLHYHLVGPCEDFDPSGLSDRWVGKNIRSLSRFNKRDLGCYEDMARLVWYLRTHAAAQRGRQSATWFGELAPVSFDPEEELGLAEWRLIQERAAEAVGLPLEEIRSGEVQRCSVDDCEAVIHMLEELPTYTADTSWMRSIPRERRYALRVVEAWVFEQSVKPPPGVADNEARIREWLSELGRLHFGTSRQEGLQAFGIEL